LLKWYLKYDYTYSLFMLRLSQARESGVSRDEIINVIENNYRLDVPLAEFEEGDIDILDGVTIDDGYGWYEDKKRRRAEELESVYNKVRLK
jgi:hypothetical protein